MQIAGRAVSRISVVIGIALATALAGGLFAAYESTPSQTIQFSTVYWGASSRSGFEYLFNDPGTSLAVDSSSKPLTVWDYVINDNTTLARFWHLAFGQFSSLPEVNLTSTTVIAVFNGGAGQGYRLNVTGVERGSSGILVDVLINKCVTCGCLTIATWYLHIISIPKSRSPVAFTRQTGVGQSC